VVTQVPEGGLTSVEQSLVEAVGRGEWLDLIPRVPGGKTVDESTMRSWGPPQTCSATVIRDILRGRLAADPDPHGLRLRGARIAGRLDLENLTTDVSLELKDCLLEEGVLARHARLASVSLADCQIEHPAKPPLDGTGLTCSMLNLTGAEIIGHASAGAVNLVGAHIGSDLTCTGAGLSNESGPALVADSLQVGQGLYLNNGFTATGSGVFGAVRLVVAHIGGNVDCSGAHLRNESGPALNADSLQVDQSMHLTGGFTASGSGGLGAVNLVGARIGGYFVCTGKLHNESGAALMAQRLQVDQNMHLRESFVAIGADEQMAVDLKGARVGGAFVFDPARLEHEDDSHQRLEVNGLTYADVPDIISPQHWRELLRHGTPYYAAQPYRQLAAGYRALGDDRQARQTLMAQRDDELARGDTHWAGRLWGRITKITLGYGYQPWRALLFLAGVVAVSCMLAVVLGAHGALVQSSQTATPGRSCTVVQQVSVGLDLNLPVGTTVARVDCSLTTDSSSATAAWLTVVGWVLRVLAWGFAALFIAGFTSAVRKT
jgi:hypothetical protein